MTVKQTTEQTNKQPQFSVIPVWLVLAKDKADLSKLACLFKGNFSTS